MDNPEGQVTYPIGIGRPGYLPALAHQRCTLRFYPCFYNQAIRHDYLNLIYQNFLLSLLRIQHYLVLLLF